MKQCPPTITVQQKTTEEYTKYDQLEYKTEQEFFSKDLLEKLIVVVQDGKYRTRYNKYRMLDREHGGTDP